MSGLLISAPQSGSGKTTVTLGLLRALRDRGLNLAPAKAGPDYIDPAFHEAACGNPCVNLDPWAMRPEMIGTLAAQRQPALLVVEGMMGLFDGAMDATGSPADLAASLGLPVVIVIDCRRMSHSVAALVRGYRDHRSDIALAGLILNRVGSERHETMLRQALEPIEIPVLGAIPSRADLELPERHLGLVQAAEHAGLEDFIASAAAVIFEKLDLDRLIRIADSGFAHRPTDAVRRLEPLGQTIAVARDDAFAFAYPHILDGWRLQGANTHFFSPLADEGPVESADAIYLPGGYPELHAGRIADGNGFRAAVRAAAARGVPVYGECGGYMVMGEQLIDADGNEHPMLGLLPLVTSFAQKKRHLGYRSVRPLAGGPFGVPMTAHEFHYATTVRQGPAAGLFKVADAAGNDLGETGMRVGTAAGSFMHLIDLAGSG